MELKENIVIVGGGIAGMAVAKNFSDNGFACTIIEKGAQLGGRVRDWACMASGRCLRCFCCSAHDLMHAIESSSLVTVMCGSELSAVTRSDSGIERVQVTSLNGGSAEVLNADALVVATGFDPYDPTEKGFWGYGRLEGVLTLGELSECIRNDRLGGLIDGIEGTPRIAFFQCVGSRDKGVGANYCSQYCCKTAVRTGIKLIHECPAWDITIFYIDLQLAGKFAGSVLDEAREKGVRFVQGVPGEIVRESDGMLHVVREDAGLNIRESFHRIVLSVGQSPSRATSHIASVIGLAVDEFGFLASTSVRDASRTEAPGVYVAGTCGGPRDIEATLEHAGHTAAAVMADLKRTRRVPSRQQEEGHTHVPGGADKEKLLPALVLGAGVSARMAAQSLADLGISATLAEVGSDESWLYGSGSETNPSESPGASQAPRADVKVVHLDRYPQVRREGFRFQVDLPLSTGGSYGCIFLASGVAMSPVPRGLPQGVGVVSPEPLRWRGERIAFLLDQGGRTNPAAGQTAIRQALYNRAEGGESFVLFRHVPVTHLFGETLYESALRSGVQFYRFGDREPTVVEAEAESEGRFRVALTDVIDSDSETVLWCDRVLVVPGPDSSSIARDALEIADNDLDKEGFLVSDSIHCHSGSSFKAGVFAVGEGTGETDLIRVTEQAASAAVKARACLMSAAAGSELETVSLTEECVRCLTCFRVCPHSAVSLSAGPARSMVRAEAAGCRECGICVSECPRLVLDQVSFPEEAVARFLRGLREANDSRSVVVYGCQRSAARLASRIDFPAGVRFFSVPCAGRVSEAILWATLAAGVRGVLVVGCHSGNCASDTGTDWAAARVKAVGEAFGMTGGPPAAVQCATIAANEPSRFGRMVQDFAAAIDHPSGAQRTRLLGGGS